MKLLNIGCGKTYHKDWINLDLIPSENVKRHNIKNKLPFGDNSIDAVYHSHVLEHLHIYEATFFLNECYRVLKKGCIMRVVVPDLEKIVREYLLNLEASARSGDSRAIRRMTFNKLEIFDQMIRDTPGGKMLEMVREAKIDPEYLRKRTGDELCGLYSARESRLKARAKSIINIFRNPRYTGEAHRWMYDRVDIKILIEDLGFINLNFTDHARSGISSWADYRLDTNAKGDGPRKPDSLYVEAEK